MLVAEFNMTPIGKGESVSQYVARVIDIVRKSGLDYRMGPMGTCIEGEWDEVFDVIRKGYEALAADCNRVSVLVRIDYRKGKKGRLKSKIASVEKKLGGEVNK
jgi:uncharacterized protein (TIGR00106 family)